MNYSELFTLMAPEGLLLLAMLAVLTIDLTTLRGEPVPVRMQWAAWLTICGCAASAAALFLSPSATPVGFLDGMLSLDPLSQLIKVILLFLAICTALVSLESNFTPHVGEYFALLLLATMGMLFLVSTQNLLLIFVALELLSLALYGMTAFNKRNPRSTEAALKYFLFGSMSAAFLLFGFSLLYGWSGELSLTGLADAVRVKPVDPLVSMAGVMVLMGFGFKIAAVPFHLWAPDVYEGAPLPSAAFIASGSKVASFFILAKVMVVGLAGAGGTGAWRGLSSGWIPLVALVAAGSVILGNLAAIAQSGVRRLLAYSAVAHAGYGLVGLLASERAEGFASVLYYVSTYALTTVGAFGVVTVIEERVGDDRLSSFAGLSRREPLLAVCLLVFLLSLAGIPPLAGFFGKFYLFKAGLFVPGGGLASTGLLWLVILAIGMSAVSLYYYLQVLKQVYVAEPPSNATAIEVSSATRALVLLIAILVVLLGCFPTLLVTPLQHAIAGIGL